MRPKQKQMGWHGLKAVIEGGITYLLFLWAVDSGNLFVWLLMLIMVTGTALNLFKFVVALAKHNDQTRETRPN